MIEAHMDGSPFNRGFTLSTKPKPVPPTTNSKLRDLVTLAEKICNKYEKRNPNVGLQLCRNILYEDLTDCTTILHPPELQEYLQISSGLEHYSRYSIVMSVISSRLLNNMHQERSISVSLDLTGLKPFNYFGYRLQTPVKKVPLELIIRGAVGDSAFYYADTCALVEKAGDNFGSYADGIIAVYQTPETWYYNRGFTTVPFETAIIIRKSGQSNSEANSEAWGFYQANGPNERYVHHTSNYQTNVITSSELFYQNAHKGESNAQILFHYQDEFEKLWAPAAPIQQKLEELFGGKE